MAAAGAVIRFAVQAKYPVGCDLISGFSFQFLKSCMIKQISHTDSDANPTTVEIYPFFLSLQASVNYRHFSICRVSLIDVTSKNVLSPALPMKPFEATISRTFPLALNYT